MCAAGSFVHSERMWLLGSTSSILPSQSPMPVLVFNLLANASAVCCATCAELGMGVMRLISRCSVLVLALYAVTMYSIWVIPLSISVFNSKSVGVAIVCGAGFSCLFTWIILLANHITGSVAVRTSCYGSGMIRYASASWYVGHCAECRVSTAWRQQYQQDS